MGNELSEEMDDPALTCPLLDKLPTKEDLMSVIPADNVQYRTMVSWCLNNWENQRDLDARWALLCAQNTSDEDDKGKCRSFGEWKDMFKRCGMDLVSTSSSLRSNKLLDFEQLMKSSSYTLAENFTLPAIIPRKCDHCKKVLEAPKFCICGEVYCDEGCRGLDKKDHREQCETVRENNTTAMALIVHWQRQQEGTATSDSTVRPREEVYVSRTLFRDNILSFGGQKAIDEVWNVYQHVVNPARIKDLRHLTYADGPVSVHACYLYGKVCNDDKVRNTYAPKKQAKNYLQRAADKGLGAAWVSLGCLAREDGDYELARQCWIRALGICRVPEAAYNIGIIYGLGYNGPKDYPLAMDFYQEAIDAPLPHCGSAQVPNAVANALIYGLYTANNETQAEFVKLAKNNLIVVQKSGQSPANMIRYVNSPVTFSSSSGSGVAKQMLKLCLAEDTNDDPDVDDAGCVEDVVDESTASCSSNASGNNGSAATAAGAAGKRKNRKKGGRKKRGGYKTKW